MGEQLKRKKCAECGAVGVGRDSELCRACEIGEEYGPEARINYLRDLGRKGAERSNSGGPGTLRQSDLPPLDSHEDAKEWARLLAEGVAIGAVDRDVAAEVRRQLKIWMQAYRHEVTDEELERIQKQMEELKRRVEQPW